MGNTNVPKVSSHKHLGVTEQNTLKWTEHIKKHIYNMCTEDRNSTSTEEEAPPIYFQEDLCWGNSNDWIMEAQYGAGAQLLSC